MTANDKPLLSIVELQEQLAFFQQRCIVLRGEVEKRDAEIADRLAEIKRLKEI